MKKITIVLCVVLALLLFIQFNLVDLENLEISNTNAITSNEMLDLDDNEKKNESNDNLFPLPNATFTDINGEEVSFEDFFGKPLVINLWASWCGPCKYEMPDFQNAYDTYGEDVQFIMISLQDGYNETMETSTDFINEHNYNMPFYFDSKREVATTLRVRSIPTTFFINSDGTIDYSHIGMIDANTLTESINNILE